MRKFKNGQRVYWNDPAGETSGEYTVLDAHEEKYADYTDEDVENYDDRIILIGTGGSEAEVPAEELDILCPLSTGEIQSVGVINDRIKNLTQEAQQTMLDVVKQYENLRLEKCGHSYAFIDEDYDKCAVVAIEIIEGDLSVELEYSDIMTSRNVLAKNLNILWLFEIMNLMLEDEVW